MFEEMARIDIERLRREGYSLTDAEVISLNDLACAIQHGKETTAANHPRFAFAGNVVLHEPTMAAMEWWWSYGHDATWLASSQLKVHYFMLAHARQPDVFDALKRPQDINRAVRAWLRGVAATSDELFRAMLYVKHNDEAQYADPADIEDAEHLDRLNHVLIEAAGATGIRPEDLRTRTRTELEVMVARAYRAGKAPKPSTARLYLKYRETIRAIEARGKGAQDGE